MGLETLTDEQIQTFLACAKRVLNPASKTRQDGKHMRRDFRVSSLDGQHEFVLFTRQSTLIDESFSAGLRWMSKTGEEPILLRCNGADHPHGNAIERTRFGAACHVHRATERYIALGKKTESYAEVNSAYSTLEGALHYLVQQANITGLATQPDQPSLFKTL